MKRSLERYLYAIGLLNSRQENVCAVDLCRFLGLKPATVSLALRQLREQGCIEKGPRGSLSFSASYAGHAEQILGRLLFFRQLLIRFGVDTATAERDAVVLSWRLSDVSYQAFRTVFSAAPD